MPESRQLCAHLILIDPGCMEAHGHHPELGSLVKDWCAARGVAAQILVGQGCAESVVASLRALPVMSQSVYVRVPPRPEKAAALLDALNDAAFRELQQNIPEPKSGAHVAVHTATHWHLQGLARFARAHHDKALKFRFLLRLPYFFSALQESVPEASADIIREYLEETFAMWKALDADVRFFTDTGGLAQHYEKIAGIPFGRVPIQVDFTDCSWPDAGTAHRPAGPVFVLPGAARREKGFDLLPDALDFYVRQGGTGSFVIQSVDGWEAETAAQLKRFGGRVNVLGEALPHRDYFRLIQSGDAVLLAYDPARYRLRTSHILIEALGAGRPVIATKGTWMEEELARFGDGAPGVLVDRYTSEALGEALLAFEENQSTYQIRALESAPAVRAAHTAEAFIAALLA